MIDIQLEQLYELRRLAERLDVPVTIEGCGNDEYELVWHDSIQTFEDAKQTLMRAATSRDACIHYRD